jgi:hypothetical protein
MPALAANKREYNLKICLVIIGLLASLCLHAGAGQKGMFNFGLQSGWSVGFKPEFGMHSIENVNPSPFIYGSTLHYHLGGHIQYNISDRFGLQFNISYQNGSYTSPFLTSGNSFFSYTLNGVYHFSERKNLRFYLLGGAGLCQGGNWIHGPDGFFMFSCGAGVKVRPRPKARSAFNLGCSFHYLLDPTNDYRSSTMHATLIRLNLGYEINVDLRRKQGADPDAKR